MGNKDRNKVITTSKGPMTMGLDEFNRKNRFMDDAVRAGKLVRASTLYENVAEIWDLNPHFAEKVVAQLEPSPLARSADPDDVLVDALQPYDEGWLTPTERARIAGRAGTQFAQD
jgi:hypothetical protein